MDELVMEAIEYLEKNNDEDYQLFFDTAKDERDNKTARWLLKISCLKKIRQLLRANRTTRLFTLAIYKGFLDDEILNNFIKYYELEKDSLISFRNYLKSKEDKKNNLPKYSYSEILITAVATASLENIKKIGKIVKLNGDGNYSGYSITLPEELLKPSNTQFIKKIGTLQSKKNS